MILLTRFYYYLLSIILLVMTISSFHHSHMALFTSSSRHHHHACPPFRRYEAWKAKYGPTRAPTFSPAVLLAKQTASKLAALKLSTDLCKTRTARHSPPFQHSWLE